MILANSDFFFFLGGGPNIRISKISTVLDNLECTESVSINNALDHIREVVIDASLNLSETNLDVRTQALNRPTLLAGQNAGHEMVQWRKTLFIGLVSDGRHDSVSSKVKPSVVKK